MYIHLSMFLNNMFQKLDHLPISGKYLLSLPLSGDLFLPVKYRTSSIKQIDIGILVVK